MQHKYYLKGPSVLAWHTLPRCMKPRPCAISLCSVGIPWVCIKCWLATSAPGGNGRLASLGFPVHALVRSRIWLLHVWTE